MRRLLLIAWRNLSQNLKRTLLLGSAIASVTLLLVVLTSVSNGISDTMLRAALTLSTGHVNIGGFFKITSGMAAPVVTRYAELEAIARRQLPKAMILDRLRGWGKIVSPARSIQVGITGIDIHNEPIVRRVLKIESGRLEDLERPNTLVLFKTQAERLEVHVGDSLTLATETVRGAMNAVDVQVVAIAKDIGFLSSFSLFASKQTIRDLYQFEPTATGAIQIYLDDGADPDRVAAELRARIAAAGHRVMEPQADPFWMKFPTVSREEWTGQKIDVTSWKDEMSFLTWIITAFNVLTAAIVGILLVIVVIGMMNTMWMSVRERTREVGTLRAIGMSRRRVLAMFLIEACLLSCAATLAGAALGCVLSVALDRAHIPLSPGFGLFLMNDTLRLLVSPKAVLGSVAAISAITTLFALFPALRAARLRPVTAMHHVG